MFEFKNYMINRAMVEFYKLKYTSYNEDMIANEYIIFVRKSYISKWLEDNFNPNEDEIVFVDICNIDISINDKVNWIKILQ